MAFPKSFLDSNIEARLSKFCYFFFHQFDLFKILEYRVPLLLRYDFSKIKRIFVFLGGRGGMKILKCSTVFLLLKKGM